MSLVQLFFLGLVFVVHLWVLVFVTQHITCPPLFVLLTSQHTGTMAKSKNHTTHNQSFKAHRNGIRKPAPQRFRSLKGVDPVFLRNQRFARKVLQCVSFVFFVSSFSYWHTNQHNKIPAAGVKAVAVVKAAPAKK
jgi:large subunit ribosomal protein L29e